MAFSDRDYTRDAVIKQLGLVELHCKDGSAVDAGCQCIDTKHLYLLEGLSEEGMGFALNAKEREFYEDLGNFVRLTRKKMEVEDYDLHGVMRETMEKKHPVPLHHSGNPYPRKYLPYGLTECEKQYPSVQKKLARCIKKLEPKERLGEIESAVAVCRATVKCP